MRATNPWKSFAAALTFAALSTPAAASASALSSLEPVTMRVSFADLDIHSDAGARVLYARLKRASKNACGVQPPREMDSIASYSQSMQCYHDLLGKAVSKIDSDALQDIHEG
ncbi:MAG TPA: UrcA family protein [Woeseiaceae bacterium]|nr:UrcA family protein [Woeseiaceae bacterium]